MNEHMELNKETALRLWTQQFGACQKAIDFAGREIAKAAYNNRSSKFGWNVDHILPQSRGGKTADHNLICCHILTNDEKSDRFPCFKANQKAFEIQKRQNHYEIISKSDSKGVQRKNHAVNLYDAAQGLKYWNSYWESDSDIFVGFVKIAVDIGIGFTGIISNTDNSTSNDFIGRYKHFLKKVFGKVFIFVEAGSSYPYKNNRYIFTIIDNSVDTQDETQRLLDNCVLLNTYSEFFIAQEECRSIQIHCGMKCYKSMDDYAECFKEDILNLQIYFQHSLAIDELIRINTSARDEIAANPYSNNSYEYNYIFTKLQKDLKKQI